MITKLLNCIEHKIDPIIVISKAHFVQNSLKITYQCYCLTLTDRTNFHIGTTHISRIGLVIALLKERKKNFFFDECKCNCIKSKARMKRMKEIHLNFPFFEKSM